MIEKVTGEPALSRTRAVSRPLIVGVCRRDEEEVQ